MRISFLAPSGYGKTTAINILKKHYELTNIRIADPLYELQQNFYKQIQLNIGDKQDGELLQFFGRKVRKESPSYLLEEFRKKVESTDLIVSNDDCRPFDYEFLKALGFVFIKINSYTRDREDHTKASLKSSLEWQEDIPYDYEIDNYKDLISYERVLLNLMEVLENEQSLHNPRTKKMQL